MYRSFFYYIFSLKCKLETHREYFFQTSFKISQSLGVIGGKPNLALYFIGCVGLYKFYINFTFSIHFVD